MKRISHADQRQVIERDWNRDDAAVTVEEDRFDSMIWGLSVLDRRWHSVWTKQLLAGHTLAKFQDVNSEIRTKGLKAHNSIYHINM